MKKFIFLVFLLLSSMFVLAQNEDVVYVLGVNEDEIEGAKTVEKFGSEKNHFKVKVSKGQTIKIKGMEFGGIKNIHFSDDKVSISGLYRSEDVFRFKENTKVKLIFIKVNGREQLKYAEFTPREDKDFIFDFMGRGFLLKLKAGKFFRFDGDKRQFEGDGVTIGDHEYIGRFKSFLNLKGFIAKTEFGKNSVLRIKTPKGFGDLEFSSKQGFVLGENGDVQISELAKNFYEINIRGDVKFNRRSFEYTGNGEVVITALLNGNQVNVKSGKGRISNGEKVIFFDQKGKEIKSRIKLPLLPRSSRDDLILTLGEKEFVMDKSGLCINLKNEECKVRVKKRFGENNKIIGIRVMKEINDALRKEDWKKVKELLNEKGHFIKKQERERLRKEIDADIKKEIKPLGEKAIEKDPSKIFKDKIYRKGGIRIKGKPSLEGKSTNDVLSFINREYLHCSPTIEFKPLKGGTVGTYYEGDIRVDSGYVSYGLHGHNAPSTLAHEMGHCMQDLCNGLFLECKKKVVSLCGELKDLGLDFKYTQSLGMYSFPYSYKNDDECYAEAFESWILTRMNPEKYKFGFKAIPISLKAIKNLYEYYTDPAYSERIENLLNDWKNLFKQFESGNLQDLIEKQKLIPVDDLIAGDVIRGEILNLNDFRNEPKKLIEVRGTIFKPSILFSLTSNPKIYRDEIGSWQIKGKFENCRNSIMRDGKVYLVRDGCKKFSDTQESVVYSSDRREVLKCFLTKDQLKVEKEDILKRFDSLNIPAVKSDVRYRKVLEDDFANIMFRIPNSKLRELYKDGLKYGVKNLWVRKRIETRYKKERDKVLKNEGLGEFIPYVDLLLRYDENINAFSTRKNLGKC